MRAAHPYFEQISPRSACRRTSSSGADGEVVQFVSCDQRAWHAGASHWRGRDNCNDWSIGIELEGLEGERFERAQYRALIRLLQALRARYPLTEVIGHEHVAPSRKADPGARFEWPRLARAFFSAGSRRPIETSCKNKMMRRGAMRISPKPIHYG